MNNRDFYDKKFLDDTLFLLSQEIEDLSAWSVYNNDLAADLIAQLKKKSDELRQYFRENPYPYEEYDPTPYADFLEEGSNL